LGLLVDWNDLHLALNQLLFVVVVALLAPFIIASQAPFGVFTLTELMTRKRKTNRTVDPHSIDVLEVVVEEFAQAPVRYYESLSGRIEQTQASLNEALDSLPQMENSLAVELNDIEDESVRALISNRIDRARRVRERLQELSEELNRQQKEAQEAIEPVVKVSEKFARLRMVGESLERITAAYDLADEAEEQVMERQYELQMLRSLSARALSRLREIDGLLTASQQARAELEAVQSVRSATEEEAEETEVRS
jgi:vacuolar-type H+-ATPase subunit I/STV1